MLDSGRGIMVDVYKDVDPDLKLGPSRFGSVAVLEVGFRIAGRRG